jgi:hypothetical protein
MSEPVLKERTTGLAIREFLQEEGEAGPNDFFKVFRRVKESTSYPSVRRYFWILKKLGLIEPTRRVMGQGTIAKQLYRIVPGAEADPRWDHPQIALYPETALGRAKYGR